MSNAIRVMIIDDHPLMRKGIAQLLSLDSKFEIVVEAKSGEEGLEFANQYQLDLILLDFNMQGISGLETLKRLRSQGHLTKIIILTVSDNKQDVIAMINHGANGYFLKDSDASLLLSNINKVLAGELVLSDDLIKYLNDLDEEDNIREKLNNLTKRERQILQEIAKGQSNKEISINLHISEGTVKVHVKSLLKKLQAKSRVEAAIVYLQQPK
ncbi:LuxR family DNA-binding response regulator [Psychromonas sp. CNPT3]|uniref:response regulator n=1 Tax=Psychromonas sp. CNPT3 TaxID=314282 RepID=UPI00006E480A|nr:response regulator [Psychromonas sp. CNPT3]AGH81243.1 LuxR family DNA-binding response regulator [Psychromonas sp. CNPT3]